MKKFVCGACGYIHEGTEAPDFCPQCNAAKNKFSEQTDLGIFADEHRIGVAAGCDERVLEMLHANFNGECAEVGMYLAMSRQADREGYPEIAETFRRYAFEEASRIHHDGYPAL